MSDAPESLVLRLLQELRQELQLFRHDQQLMRDEFRGDIARLTKEITDLKRSILGLSYLGTRLAADVKDHADRIAALEARTTAV